MLPIQDLSNSPILNDTTNTRISVASTMPHLPHRKRKVSAQSMTRIQIQSKLFGAVVDRQNVVDTLILYGTRFTKCPLV